MKTFKIKLDGGPFLFVEGRHIREDGPEFLITAPHRKALQRDTREKILRLLREGFDLEPRFQRRNHMPLNDADHV